MQIFRVFSVGFTQLLLATRCHHCPTNAAFVQCRTWRLCTTVPRRTLAVGKAISALNKISRDKKQIPAAKHLRNWGEYFCS